MKVRQASDFAKKKYYYYCLAKPSTAISNDYVPVADLSLTFTPTNGRHCFDMIILEDTVPEDDENFILKLTADDSVVILAPSMAEVRIIDTINGKKLSHRLSL